MVVIFSTDSHDDNDSNNDKRNTSCAAYGLECMRTAVKDLEQQWF